MIKINNDEYKKKLIELLEYINQVAKKNNIKYSLIGGSLIGAVREKGIIPWDDDIDIILNHSEYIKLIEILKTEKSDTFKLLYPGMPGKIYNYPFPKLVNKKTVVIEKGLKKTEDLGIYLDIFEFNQIPNNKLFQKIHYKRISRLKKLIGILGIESYGLNERFLKLKKLRKYYVEKIGAKKIINKFTKLVEKYNNKNFKYVVSNWPAYGFNKEIHEKKWINEFKEVKFENIDAMIYSNYDKILTTTFNNYMERPPVEKRISHNIEAYWKE